MTTGWINSGTAALLFLISNAAHASSSLPVNELFAYIQKSPTGNEIATKLRLLIDSENPEQRLEIHYIDELDALDQDFCSRNPKAVAGFLDYDYGTKNPSRILFCKPLNFYDQALTLAHEGQHALDGNISPHGQKINLEAQFLSQKPSSMAFAFHMLRSLAMEYSAYLNTYRVYQDLYPSLPKDPEGFFQTDILVINPSISYMNRISIVSQYVHPTLFPMTVTAYEMISKEFPDIASDFYRFIPKSDLEDMIRWMKSVI